MSDYEISSSARIDAPAASCYGVIADYHVGHPAIVPPRAFGSFVVEAGGTGAGTRVRFTMKALGQERTVLGIVTEPEPGRVLVESYPESGVVTTFIVEPLGDRASKVTISSVLPSPDGLRGVLERWFTRTFLLGVYREELGRLAMYLREGGASSGVARAS